MELGSALIILTLLIGAEIKNWINEYRRKRLLQRREKQFFNRNPYATILYHTMKGETSKWV